MAKEDETALMLHSQAQEGALAQAKKENAALKKQMPGLPTVVKGGVAVVVAGAIGLAEGYKGENDAAKEKGGEYYLPAAGLVGGLAVTAFAGNMPKIQAAAAGVAEASAVLIAYTAGRNEGRAMVADALQKAKAAPGVQGLRRVS